MRAAALRGARRAQVEAAGRTPEARGRLHWLDVADQLLTPDGSRIRPHLQLDGTHMAPAFVHTLEAAAQRALGA
jgi:hypothetical protein